LQEITLFSFFYNLFLHFLGLFFLPILLYRSIVQGKYRKSLKYRFGVGFPRIDKGEKTLIWVHAVSVGETKAVASLVRRLKNDGNIIILSCITETGHAEGARSIPEADYHLYLPLDLPYIIKPIVRRCRPDMVILCETDFWWNFLSESKGVGAEVLLVNGKLSERSLLRYSKIPWAAREVFSLFSCFCVQNKVYADRFVQVAVPEDKICVTGNLKFDDSYTFLSEKELGVWRHKLGIKKEQPVVVLGSTHETEETGLLKAMEKVWEHFPDMMVLLVPRHPERFDYVRQLVKGNNKVVLIDKMGCLREIYQLGDIAIVGGSFVTVGGHNILEPVRYGIPVMFGPYMHSQPGMEDLVLEYGVGVKTELFDVADNVIKLLFNEKNKKSVRSDCERLFNDVKGSVDKTFMKIVELNKGLC
jgi:3-deoxy-D-manno-octulosonic-acid transferase